MSVQPLPLSLSFIFSHNHFTSPFIRFRRLLHNLNSLDLIKRPSAKVFLCRKQICKIMSPKIIIFAFALPSYKAIRTLLVNAKHKFSAADRYLIYNNKALIFSPFHNQSLRFFFVSLPGRDKATHKNNAKKAADCNTG